VVRLQEDEFQKMEAKKQSKTKEETSGHICSVKQIIKTEISVLNQRAFAHILQKNIFFISALGQTHDQRTSSGLPPK